MSAPLTHHASRQFRGAGAEVPPALTDGQALRLDCLIARLRTGTVDEVVLHHLEIDGVLQLDPLVDLTACPAGEEAALCCPA